MQVSFSTVTEDTFFEVLEAFERYNEDCKEEKEFDILQSKLLKCSLDILSYRYDIDDDAQAQKDLFKKEMCAFTAHRLRKEFLKQLLPLKVIFENSLERRKTGNSAITKKARSGFSLLTKNALQNVV